jgi:hypothetical protein
VFSRDHRQEGPDTIVERKSASALDCVWPAARYPESIFGFEQVADAACPVTKARGARDGSEDSARRVRRRSSRTGGLSITTDLPDDIPVSERELEAIEIYLAQVVDELFGGAG